MGGGIKKEKTQIRNGGVEEAENYKKGERFYNMAANHIKIILFKTDCPPCFEPAVLVSLKNG